ncbi:Oligopeptide transport system permease OppB [Klebsiella aerogenes]|nr:Oligopeptide transport system permease OppB [Klebsiella aerogenes]
MFFTGSLLIEVMFSLNGLGLLAMSTVSRDYPVMFGTLYIFTLIGLLLISSAISAIRWSTRALILRAANVFLQSVNQARWARFRHNRRGYWSLWLF